MSEHCLFRFQDGTACTKDAGHTLPHVVQMDFTDQVGEWCVVLEHLEKKETKHLWRKKKLKEIAAFLRSTRPLDVQLALEAQQGDADGRD